MQPYRAATTIAAVAVIGSMLIGVAPRLAPSVLDLSRIRAETSVVGLLG